MNIRALAGTIIVFLISLGSFLFFLIFINPEYLDFSGFLAFYISLLGWSWSLVLLSGYYIDRKILLPDAITESFFRRSGLFSGFIIINALMSQIGLWSVYAMIWLVAGFFAFEDL